MRFLSKADTDTGRARRKAPGASHQQGAPRAKRLRAAEKEIAALRHRVATLEQEVQECRQLNKRLAEITDVVTEVLLPAEHRDEERLHALLRRYDSTI